MDRPAFRKGDVAQTIANNLVTFRKAQAWFDAAGVRPDQATSADLEDLFDCLRQKHAPSTLRGHLSRLRAAYAYAVRHGLVSLDPTQDVVLPKMPDVEPETYTNEELRCILAHVRDDSEQAIVHLLIYAGLRRHEVIRLEWKDVEFDRRQMKVLGKGSKLRLVPLHPVLQDALAELPPVGPHVVVSAWKERVSAFTFNRKLRDLLERSQVDGGRRPAHKFRKTLATSLFENGAQERVIDRIFGWAPTTVRDRHYTRVADVLMQRAILVGYGDDPLSVPRRPMGGLPQTRNSKPIDAGMGLAR